MVPADIPDHDRIVSLLDARPGIAVTITLASSPVPAEHQRVKAALRSAIDEVQRRLAGGEGAGEVVEALTALIDDDEFWQHQPHGLVAFAAPGTLEVFRLPDTVADSVAVSDRFDVVPLLRAAARPHRAFVLQLSQGMTRLTELGVGEGVVQRRLRLPDDHALMLQHASNDGDSDRDRASGSTGDRIERERFCRAVQDEVVRIVPRTVPLILSSTPDLEPAYRSVNTHPLLLADAISANPESLDDHRLQDEARTILDRRDAEQTSQWKERFGSLRAQNLATSRLAEVAAAAVSAAVEELRFNVESDLTGTIDEFGRVTRSDDDTAPRLVDEIAARVLHTGGRVLAVTNAELLDGSPVAATLRFPVSRTS